MSWQPAGPFPFIQHCLSGLNTVQVSRWEFMLHIGKSCRFRLSQLISNGSFESIPPQLRIFNLFYGHLLIPHIFPLLSSEDVWFSSWNSFSTSQWALIAYRSFYIRYCIPHILLLSSNQLISISTFRAPVYRILMPLLKLSQFICDSLTWGPLA